VHLTLEGKAALVTGASKGIGLAIARRFAEAGAAVMLSSRNPGALEQAAKAISDAGSVAAWHAADAGDPRQAPGCVAETVSRFGGLDILVNNAGTNPHYGPLLEIDEAKAARAVQVNQQALVSWTGAAWRASMRERGGTVVNIAAIGGMAVYPNSGWYNATKAAVIHLTRQLAYELGPAVRVNAIAPGVVQTGFARAMADEYGDAGSRQRALRGGDALADRLPLRRLGVPDDIAAAALFLASDAASWITGHTLVVDGGGLSMPLGGVL
jgi:NAD(P)-dependent dehydrogenase (short-subunit alcohol dehydrogenase family)